MTIVSASDFRANQGKYLGMALEGHDVVLRSRRGNFRLTLVEDDEEPRRDVTSEVCQGLEDFRAYLDGDKSRMVTWEEMMDELRD